MACEVAVQRCFANFRLGSDLAHRHLTAFAHGQRCLELACAEHAWRTADTPALALKLGQGSEQVQLQSFRGGVGVDAVVQGTERDPAALKLGGGEQMLQVSPEANPAARRSACRRPQLTACLDCLRSGWWIDPEPTSR